MSSLRSTLVSPDMAHKLVAPLVSLVVMVPVEGRSTSCCRPIKAQHPRANLWWVWLYNGCVTRWKRC